jgi:asparagine synthase (glutamine-hydrolysing)
MCGFIGLFDARTDTKVLRPQVLEMSKKIRHRGPDWSGVFLNEKVILSHERLAIVDPISGGQPLISPDKNLVLAVNGEIYNHQHLRTQFIDRYAFQTQSDCEVILALYQEKGIHFLDELNGIFAFALYDIEKQTYFIARDHMGIIPLYMGWDKLGQFYVSSELKSLEGVCNRIEEFLPGHYLYSAEGQTLQPWYTRNWMTYEGVESVVSSIEKIREGLELAVERQLMSDVPYGVLLSGGLDSSIIAAIAKKLAPKRIESGNTQEAWWPQLHSFAVGLKDAPDLKMAKRMADYIGTVHHEIHFTIQEGLDALRDVIYHLETYDVTTVRASTPMYLLARYIKSMGIKMVLSGEGSDELFGGYLYFHKAPDPKSFHEETVRKLSKLHSYDCLRANKSLAAWGVEGRVPFLDKEFMDVAMTQHPKDKMVDKQSNIPHRGIEKYILRKAFEDLLPDFITWRQKEQFSDGVGYSWIDSLKALTAEAVSDEDMQQAAYRFPVHTPLSKEEYYYRSIFSEHFPTDTAARTVPSVPSVACSTPEALAWDPSFATMNDPSGRAMKDVHSGS